MKKELQKHDSAAEQSSRFIEAAKKAGVDESGRKFARVFKKVMTARKPTEPTAPKKPA